MVRQDFQGPVGWDEWNAWLSAGLHGRNHWRLSVLLFGILFAGGRRTVGSWLRAAGITDDYVSYYYFLSRLGDKASMVAAGVFTLVLKLLPLGSRLLLVIDDTPTKRYGPFVEGADVHHNPTPGPADQEYLYGHMWVTLSLALRHPLWGPIGLPLRAMLYVRRFTLERIPRVWNWRFRTKLELATRLVMWAIPYVQRAGKTLWVVADGAYAKAPFLKPLLEQGITVVNRLRKDAHLHSVPRPRTGQRGRPRKYGEQRIDLAKRAGQKKGWHTITCTLYGKESEKTYKTFLATSPPVGGLIRVVLVREEDSWCAFFCTDATAPVEDILQTFADRATIEQVFHDIKEVHGAGKQQLRNIWSNVSAFNMILWMHTLVELWAWNHPHEQLCDRSDSPWDDPLRRPSHANRRKALRQIFLRNELSSISRRHHLPAKISQLCQRLLNLAG